MSRILKAVIVVYMGVLLVAQVPEIVDPYTSREGMVNWIGPVRHGGDIAYSDTMSEASRVSYFKRQGLHWASPGHTLLVKIMRQTGDLVLWAKVIPWLLMPLVLFVLFRLGERLAGPVAGFFACLLYLHMPLLQSNLVAIPACFALPTLIAFLYFLQRDRPWSALACMAAGGVFYPSIVINCSALYVLRLARDPDSGRIRLSLRDRRLWALGATLVALFIMIAPPWEHTYHFIFDSGWAPSLVSYTEEILREARLQLGGPLPPTDGLVHHTFPHELIMTRWARDIGTALMQPLALWGIPLVPFPRATPLSLILGIQGLLVLGFLAWIGPRRASPPRLVKDLLWTGLSLYMLAVVVFPYLFWPQRFVVFSLSMAVVLLAAVFAARAVEGLSGRKRQAAPLVLAAAFLLLFGSGIPLPFSWTEDYRPARRVLDHLKKTPQKSVVAGPLFLMDGVELISNRDTFLYCQEVIMTGHFITGSFYKTVRTRHQELLAAYYGTNPESILSFMDRHGIDYMVVNTEYFRRDFTGEYEPPCTFLPSDMARPKIVQQGAYFLARPPAEVMTISSDGYKVVSRTRLRAYLAKRPGSGGRVPR